MHEMSIAQSLLDIVLEESRKHDLASVRVVRLQIGAMAGVVPEALTFCFELLTRDTLASGALLEIETTAVVARCSGCERLVPVEDRVFLCSHCGDPLLELVSGRELSIMSIEGDTGNDHGSD